MAIGDRSNGSNATDGPTVPITSELVREVTTKVYAMLLRDLRLERERQRGMVGNRSNIRSNRRWR